MKISIFQLNLFSLFKSKKIKIFHKFQSNLKEKFPQSSKNNTATKQFPNPFLISHLNDLENYTLQMNSNKSKKCMNNRKKKLFLFNCFQPEGKRYYFCEIMLFNFYYVKKPE